MWLRLSLWMSARVCVDDCGRPMMVRLLKVKYIRYIPPRYTLVSSNANNALNTGPLYLNANNVTSNVNVNIGTGIRSKLSMIINTTGVCTLAKTTARTNDKPTLLIGSLETCRRSGRERHT